MHIPKHFSITDQTEIRSFIHENAFGQLVSIDDSLPVATHMPFHFCQDKGRLSGHLAGVNSQVKHLDGQDVLIILQGPHDYISPSWYENPGVPTWNYQAVHLYGRCHTFDDPSRLKEIVETLTSTYESGYAKPWNPDYQPAMLNAIIGIDIHITEIQCQYKLSQNRKEEDQQRVIEELRKKGSHALASAMEKQLQK